MNAIQFRYFKGDMTKEPLKTIIDTWYKLRAERDKKLTNIFNTIPFYESWLGDETSIFGIVCSYDNPARDEAVLTKGYRTEDYKGKCVVKPDRRYKVGKDFDKKLQAIRQILKEAPDFSSYSLKELGMYLLVGHFSRLYFSVSGVQDDIYIAKIPVKEQGNFGDDFLEIHECLTEIKESEFLSIQGL